MEELKRVMDHRKQLLGDDAPSILGVCLSSRRNMCIHPEVVANSDREQVDAMCRKKTAPWVRQQADTDPSDSNIEEFGLCSFYEKYSAQGSDLPLHEGIFNVDDMQALGREKGWCPYFVTRHVLSFANVIVYNYQYMLDPKVSNMVSNEISRDSIIVFDEAHNIDNVCIEALSVNFNSRSLDRALRNTETLGGMVRDLERSDKARLTAEYERLVRGLSETLDVDDALSNPIHLPEEILNEAIPGTIRQAGHFVQMLGSVTKYLMERMKVSQVEKETPSIFLQKISQTLTLETKPFQFFYSRLSSLMRTLKIIDLEEFIPISQVSDFLTLVSTPKYKDGFMLILEPYDPRTPEFRDPILQFACLDASLAIKPVLDRFQSVIITSGTLSPIDLYPKLLNFKPIVAESLCMSIIRPCICPMIVTRGSDQTPITSAYSARNDKSVIINYGSLLVELARNVPDGIVCFFTSYEYLENVVSEWFKLQTLDKILQHKLLFIETKDIVETTLALDNFRRACDSGRGAIFLSVARGKVSEGIDFDRHYGRCVVLFGIPFQYTKSHILLARLEYLRTKFQIKEEDFLSFDALRQSAQCVGRVIRSKADYGIMIFADQRYNHANKISKLPQWITQFLTGGNKNLSTEEAVTVCKEFLRDLAQPPPPGVQYSKMLTEADLQQQMIE